MVNIRLGAEVALHRQRFNKSENAFTFKSQRYHEMCINWQKLLLMVAVALKK
jgi:hypothetical protein